MCTRDRFTNVHDNLFGRLNQPQRNWFFTAMIAQRTAAVSYTHLRPCDCHPLLLSAGKLVRPVIRPIGQANPLQNRQCAFAPLMPRNALQRQRQRDIFQCCHARQQPELLKHKADLLTAQTRPLFCRQMRDRCSVCLLYTSRCV